MSKVIHLDRPKVKTTSAGTKLYLVYRHDGTPVYVTIPR
jgi:hypothetical protein